jgi:hypothetical protein
MHEITIYRKEDWFGVWIHEGFHVFGWDYLCVPCPVKVPGSSGFVSPYIPKQSVTLQCEGLVDAMACYVHSLWLGGVKNFQNYLEKEIQYQWKQVEYIYSKKLHLYPDETNMWSYYFCTHPHPLCLSSSIFFFCSWFVFVVKHALLLDMSTVKRLEAWLSQDSVDECRKTWPEFVHQCLTALYVLGDFTSFFFQFFFFRGHKFFLFFFFLGIKN